MVRILELDFEHNAIRCIPGYLPKGKLTDYIVMQSTGLEDKNGKEVFEGDVIRIIFKIETFNNEGIYQKSTTKEEIQAVTMPALDFNTYPGHNDTGRIVISIEILGNIWENKDLIKNETQD